METISAERGTGQALKILQRGGIVAHATETCYGLACDVRNANAVAKLFAMKRRPADMPISVLFESLEQAKEYVEWNECAESFIHELPGPVTLILPLKKTTPTPIFVQTGQLSAESCQLTAGMRVSSHPLASELVRQFSSPLSTTSANLHGKPPPYSVEDILLQFSEAEPAPDLILDSGTLEKRSPSQVIDCTGTTPRLLRT